MPDLILKGTILGPPFAAGKGYILKLVVPQAVGAKVFSVFSKDPSLLSGADDKGQIEMPVNVQDFVFADGGNKKTPVSV